MNKFYINALICLSVFLTMNTQGMNQARLTHFLSMRLFGGELDRKKMTSSEIDADNKFKENRAAIVIAREAYSQRQPQDLVRLETSINQRLLLLRQRYGRPVDGYTGNFVELNARRDAGQTAINNPSAESIRLSKTMIDNAEFNELFSRYSTTFYCWKSALESIS